MSITRCVTRRRVRTGELLLSFDCGFCPFFSVLVDPPRLRLGFFARTVLNAFISRSSIGSFCTCSLPTTLLLVSTLPAICFTRLLNNTFLFILASALVRTIHLHPPRTTITSTHRSPPYPIPRNQPTAFPSCPPPFPPTRTKRLSLVRRGPRQRLMQVRRQPILQLTRISRQIDAHLLKLIDQHPGR
jgi:hypothetical protein